MGLLDEAIKEHLDLKRRRGADPAEVERAEREALGPVRRAPAARDDEASDEASAGFAYDHEDESDWGGEPSAPSAPRGRGEADAESDLEPDFEADSYVDAEPEAPAREQRPSRLARIFGRSEAEPDVDEPVVERRPPRASDAEDPFDESDSYSADRPAGPARGQLGEETTEYRVESALDEEEEPDDGEDVLEETPEFLQDTPDHDRLWFEQRPPKDFDFDG
jgi:hypothetical protein